jgi:hypothetical protein
MTFSGTGSGVAVGLPDFNYGSIDPLPSKSSGRISYRPALTVSERDTLLDAITNWKLKTAHFSLRSDKVLNEVFEKIISFGSSAVPYLIEDLRLEPSYLFLALERITGRNPVFEEIRGNIPAIVGAWLQWYESETRERT